jgi:cytochrome P450
VISVDDYQPLTPHVVADPYPYYAVLRRDAPVHHLPDLDVWVVSRYDDVLRVLSDAETFTSEAMATLVVRPGGFGERDEPTPVSIVGTDGAYHTRLRRIVGRAFTPRRIAEMEEDLRATARPLVDAIVGRGRTELLGDLAVPLPVIAIADLLGVDAAERDDFRRWSNAMVCAVFERPDAEQGRQIAASLAEMEAWVDRVLAREQAATPGLVPVLMRAEDDEVLTRPELITFLFTLLVAGSVTTTHLIANAVIALATNPDALEWLRRRPEQIAGAVEEALRFDAPFQLGFRTAARSVTIAGIEIPARATVVPAIGSANRDGSVFADPDRFDAARTGATAAGRTGAAASGRAHAGHLSFGYGPHFCLGAALARLEAKVALEELLARIDAVRIATPVQYVESLVFRGPTRLDLEVAPLNAAAPAHPVGSR